MLEEEGFRQKVSSSQASPSPSPFEGLLAGGGSIVEDSDGTLILARGSPQGGTALTLKLARKLNKPFLLVDLARNPEPSEVRHWVQKNQIRILNVAGPREGESAGIFEKASAFLRGVLTTPRP